MNIEDILDTTNGDYIQLGLKAPLFKGVTKTVQESPFPLGMGVVSRQT